MAGVGSRVGVASPSAFGAGAACVVAAPFGAGSASSLGAGFGAGFGSGFNISFDLRRDSATGRIFATDESPAEGACVPLCSARGSGALAPCSFAGTLSAPAAGAVGLASGRLMGCVGWAASRETTSLREAVVALAFIN